MHKAHLEVLAHYNKVRRSCWNRARVVRLCQMLGTNHEALGLMMGCRPGDMTRYLKENKLPGTACYVLELWESHFLAKTVGEKLTNVMPDPVTPVRAALLGLKKIADGKVENPQELASKLIERIPELAGDTQ
jgi:hypothetical protein